MYSLDIETIAPGQIVTLEWRKLPMDRITKKFYVGANKVFIPSSFNGQTWAKRTESEAIEHAKQLLEASPNQEFAFIVKVIKVVKRDRPPYKVEVVK